MKVLNNFIQLHLDLVNLKINKKKSKVCINIHCNKQGVFNYKCYKEIDIKKYIYCKDHKLNNMIDIQNKKCIKCNITRPSFNYKNTTEALYCVNCKELDMVNTITKKCIGCKFKQPCFNYLYETKPIYCADCKEIDMVDIKSKKCIICNIKHPTFNYNNNIIALYCAQCAMPDMVDVKNKKCIVCKSKQPVFNYENEIKPMYCMDCKEIDMIDIRSKKCIICNIKQPNYNYKNEKSALYCKSCKDINMIDIKHIMCKTELCDIRPHKKYKGYCLRCFIYNYPNDKLIRDYGTREAKVSQFIKETYTNLNITYNKAVEGGCSSHRPDIFIDCLTHSVIIEIDEHQHKKGTTYNPECELRRLNNLFTDLGDRSIVFIRFNPDSYINKKNKLVKGCFEYTEDKGLPKANKTLQTRLKKLKSIIDENLIRVPEENITIIKLYYDGY